MSEYAWFILMLQLVKLPVVDRIQWQSNTFAIGVENKATADWFKTIELFNSAFYTNVFFAENR